MTHDDNSSEKKSGDEKARKERVLHTRIPAVLEQELKELATNLRVPVSNLVRTILQDALATAEVVGRVAEEELRGAAERLAAERIRLETAAAVQGDAIRESLRKRGLDPSERPWGGSADPAPGPSAAPTAEPTADPEAGAPADPVGRPDDEPADPLAGVVGFQELLLAVKSACALCGIQLEVGEPAYLGVRTVPGPQVIIGAECLPGKKKES